MIKNFGNAAVNIGRWPSHTNMTNRFVEKRFEYLEKWFSGKTRP